MQTFLWLFIAVAAVVVVIFIMRGNAAPPAAATAPNGQPVPQYGYGNPQAAGSDQGGAIAGMVAAGFNLVTSFINAANAKKS